MKQLNSTILLTMLFCMFGAKANAHDIEVANADGVTIYYLWTNNTTELEVSCRGEYGDSYSNEYTGNVVIPQSVEYNGATYNVTSIGLGAFLECSGLTSVTIPNSVTSIEGGAFFWCTGLTSVTIPNSVTSIGEDAFQSCTGLTSITIPNSVTSIGERAFSGCSGLTSITIPNSVTSIGDGAFAGCTGLTSVYIHCSPTSVGSKIFYSCDKISTVEFDCERVSPIFREVQTIETITLTEKVINIGEDAFQSCTGLTSITIPNSVTSIGYDAFGGCSGLTSVHITDLEAWYKISFNGYGSNPLECAHHLFLNGVEIKDLVIPNSVTSIGDNAFKGCTGLTSITIPNSVTSIGYDAFSGCSGLTSVTIPNSVTSIESGAFYLCAGLTSVTIPNSVTSIGSSAFSGCAGLTSVTIPNSVTSIGTSAFSGCAGLTSITIPNSVTTIGYYAFAYCSGLTSITIPNSVTSIGNGAFYECTNLRTVTSYITEPYSIKNDIFPTDTYRQGTLYVPIGTKEIYGRFDGWREFLKIIEVDDSGEQLYLTLQSGNQGEIKLAVKRGENYTFLLEPESGWKINSVTYNGTDVTNQLDSQNKFTTPSIADNAVLSITYEQSTQGIRPNKASNIKVSVSSDAVIIDGAESGSTCRVYSLGGELLQTATLSGEREYLTLSSGQVYLIKIGDSVFKVGL